MRDDTLFGILALRITLRDDARQAVEELHQLGVQGVILTGDNPRAAAAIANELGLQFRAGLLPADKVNAVMALNANAPLAMVGDGINDAPGDESGDHRYYDGQRHRCSAGDRRRGSDP